MTFWRVGFGRLFMEISDEHCPVSGSCPGSSVKSSRTLHRLPPDAAQASVTFHLQHRTPGTDASVLVRLISPFYKIPAKPSRWNKTLQTTTARPPKQSRRSISSRWDKGAPWHVRSDVLALVQLLIPGAKHRNLQAPSHLLSLRKLSFLLRFDGMSRALSLALKKSHLASRLGWDRACSSNLLTLHHVG